MEVVGTPKVELKINFKKTMEKKYCRDCVMSCYKDGLQVKEENCTENPEECSFKHEHIDYSNLKVNK